MKKKFIDKEEITKERLFKNIRSGYKTARPRNSKNIGEV